MAFTKRPLYFAAWSGVAVAIIGAGSFIINIIINSLDSTRNMLLGFQIAQSLAMGVLFVFFYFGFIQLGKKHNIKILVWGAWANIIFSILWLFVGILVLMNVIITIPGVVEEYGLHLMTPEEQESFLDSLPPDEAERVRNELTEFAIRALIVLISFIIIMAAISITFGVALLKMKDKHDMAKATGIVEIIAGATLIILIGFIIKIVAYVMEILMLFNASKKLEPVSVSK